MRRSNFGSVLEAAGSLPLEDKEELIALLNKRTIEERRNALANDIKAARAEFRRGKAKAASASAIVKEILS